MYDKIPFILGILIGVLGLVMAVVPKSATKKENRESEQEIKKTRIYGIILTVVGIGIFIIGFIK